MKTPLQELLQTESDLTHMFDSDKIVAGAMLEYIRTNKKEMLEKEKEVIISAANNGCMVGGCCIDKPRDGEIYYNKTFNTKEK